MVLHFDSYLSSVEAFLCKLRRVYSYYHCITGEFFFIDLYELQVQLLDSVIIDSSFVLGLNGFSYIFFFHFN